MNTELKYIQRFFLLFLLGFSILLVFVALWYKNKEYTTAGEYARIEGDASFHKDILYRKWAAIHGGVYVPTTKETPPNPYLKYILNRDIITIDGKRFTLLNPAYMSRQVFELGEKDFGIKAHITSLKPIRPENKADTWETKALKKFEAGETQFSEIQKINGKEYMRFMHSLKTEEKCLKCHSHQGYKIGDIRGGISVSVPMDKYFKIASSKVVSFVLFCIALFLLIAIILFFSYKKITSEAKKREKIQEQLLESRNNLSKQNTEYFALFEEYKKINSELFEEKEKLSISEEKFKCIVQSSPTAMYFYHLEENGDLILIDSNPAADKTLGIPHDKLIGKKIEEAFPNLKGTEIPEIYKKVARKEISNQSLEIEYSDERFSGFFSVHVFVTQENYIAVNFFDITDIKKAEKEIQQQSEELQQLNADKDRFIQILAHDLRNPFNTLLGYSDLLLKNFHKYETSKIISHIEIIYKSSKNAFNLLNDLLLWSKAQAGKITFKPEIFFVKEICQPLFEEIKTITEEKKLTIIYSENKAEKVFADEKMLSIIIRNLLTNAIKFTNKRGIIAISAIETTEFTIITVKDNGVGISEEDKQKLWDFSISHTTTGTAGEQGTGLGLILCKELIEKQNGKIVLESEVGKGTTFFIYLPNKDCNR